MGRTFETLTKGRGSRRFAVVDSSAPSVIPMPTIELDPSTRDVELVPFNDDDLPSDNNALPYIEVGGPRKAEPKPEVRLVAPKPQAKPAYGEMTFHLLGDWEQLPKATGIIPEELVAYHRPEHPLARQYRLLVDGISTQLPKNRTPALLFTPVSNRLNATWTVLNLAATRASDGNGRVLVVELERTETSSSTSLGVPATPGLRELLTRNVPLTLSLHRTGVEGMLLLPAGKAEVGIDEFERLPGLLNQFRAKFDWILIEAPSWGTMPLNDYAKSSDGVYLVMNPDEWDSQHADAAHQHLLHAGGKVRGCVTTR
jgi:Mrp family chromosome partitioning ATPase